MKTALITGGGSGIGQAIAWELAKHEMTVYIVGRRAEKLEETSKQYPKLINTIVADITTDEGISQIISSLSNVKLDYLINNAGQEGKRELIQSLSRANWRNTHAINIEAPTFLTKALLPHLKQNARILMVSTGLAHYALPNFSAYCTSKAALNMLAKCLNAELNQKQIFTSILDPGPVDTDMQARLREMENKDKANFFHDMQSKGMLDAPANVAAYAVDKLLNTNNPDFIKNEWSYSS